MTSIPDPDEKIIYYDPRTTADLLAAIDFTLQPMRNTMIREVREAESMSAKGHKKTAGSGTDGNEKERIFDMTTLTQKDVSFNWIPVLEHLKEQPGAGYYDGTPEEVRACRSFAELDRHSFNLLAFVSACYKIGVPYDVALRYANADVCTAAISRQQKEERDND